MLINETLGLNMIKVYAKAPTRIDIAGGTVDMAPLSQILDNKMTVNLGVELHAEVWIDQTQVNAELKVLI